ncbi:MAG: alpha-hydroxy acid oxidase [Alphaproteobacteria bacterium]
MDFEAAKAAGFENLHEVVRQARINLNANIWDYLVGGTESETTLRRNRLALDTVAFRPRVLNDVSKVDLTCEFLGKRLDLPVCAAPVGSLESFHEEGGAAMVKGCAEAGTAMMLSSVSQPGLEAVAKAAPDALRIFQLYVRGDTGWIDDIAKRAIANDYTAFCLTVDTAHYSRRERDIDKRFDKRWRRGDEYMAATQAALSWSEVERFKGKHDIPLILKGIATGEDAKIAVEHGVEVVYVSNHGGRQLDHGRGAMDVLPEVVDAIAGRAKIMVDGSFLRGSDIVKGIAAGADCIGIGRMAVAGLAGAGQAGVARVMHLLKHEASICFGLLGVTGWDQLTTAHIHRGAPAVTDPSVWSAFPLLDSPR